MLPLRSSRNLSGVYLSHLPPWGTLGMNHSAQRPGIGTAQAIPSYTPLQGGIWCTSIRQWYRSHLLGNTFVAVTRPGYSGVFMSVAVRWIKVQGKRFYLTKFRSNAIFRTPNKSCGLPPCYPPFIHLSLLSHWPHFYFHPPTQLSDHQSLLLFPLILSIDSLSKLLPHCLR